MKFTKEQFSEALKVKLTNNGKKNLAMSERSFNGKVERIYKRLEKASDKDELELDDVVADYLDDLQEDDNNIRNDNSKFIKEWEKNHPNKDDRSDNKDDKGDESKLDKLLKELQDLKSEREEEKKIKAISDKRNQLKLALKGKEVKNEDWINDQLELIHIDSETDVDALTERLVKSYNKFNANTPPDITPGGTGSGKEKTDDFADVVAVVKKQSHREEK
ncbi:hypothetical protein [Phocaeicola dorei]|jgi:hypothetical protein|uniref:hypothetical protein n=1 Tax=Phocaeicola dorei TaxID=357276 RepID=UPI00205B8B99|nr:MAG TPA: hypothetical protein [Caudoviricetes sp.]DAQ76928.1 MAG TPA: hypothetical protein [Caudoviricetes sp.]DAS51481.1 MAG TPA: hypothetical protein [Caudoviricetes sp.]